MILSRRSSLVPSATTIFSANRSRVRWNCWRPRDRPHYHVRSAASSSLPGIEGSGRADKAAEVRTEPSEPPSTCPRLHFALTSGDGCRVESGTSSAFRIRVSQNPRPRPTGKCSEDEGASLYLVIRLRSLPRNSAIRSPPPPRTC